MVHDPSPSLIRSARPAGRAHRRRLTASAGAAALAALALVLGPASPAGAAAGNHGNASPGGYPNALGSGLYRLDGLDPALPQGDLAPLARIVDDAQVVALGESYHTSGGFYLMKHRIIRYLVEEKGFRVLGWEANLYAAERVERYVQTCEGSPEDFLPGLFITHRSTETRDLFEWMCRWNQEHPDDRLHVYGFDMQGEARQHADDLFAFLLSAGVPADHPWLAAVGACDRVDERYLPERPHPPEKRAACLAALGEIAGFLAGEERSLARATSREAIAWARVHVVALATWADFVHYIFGVPPTFESFQRWANARDYGMAYLAQAVRELRFPHQRTALWMHNGHAMRDSEISWGVVSTGAHLDAWLGKKYAAIGLGAREVYANWRTIGRCGLRTFNVTNPVEEELSRVGASALLVDLDPRGSHAPYLPPGVVYELGDVPAAPARHWDALVYLDVSPAMHPLAWPVPTCP